MFNRKPIVVREIERRLAAVEAAETTDTLKRRVVGLEQQRHTMNNRLEEVERTHREITDRLNKLVTRENQRLEFIKSICKATE